jgi:hypothetical protein
VSPAPEESHVFTAGDVEEILNRAIQRMEDHAQREKEEAKAAAKRKERMTSRTSTAAFTLTMLLSFLGFVRSGTDGKSSGLKGDATKAGDQAASEWALYQTRTAQRGEFMVGEDSAIREVQGQPADSPLVRLARFNYAEYQQKIEQLDEQNREVFYVIQDLDHRVFTDQRDSAHFDQQTHWYDMGVRTLTLALVLISVTLLANREYLFWMGLVVALAGATLAINGYFLIVT